MNPAIDADSSDSDSDHEPDDTQAVASSKPAAPHKRARIAHPSAKSLLKEGLHSPDNWSETAASAVEKFILQCKRRNFAVECLLYDPESHHAELHCKVPRCKNAKISASKLDMSTVTRHYTRNHEFNEQVQKKNMKDFFMKVITIADDESTTEVPS